MTSLVIDASVPSATIRPIASVAPARKDPVVPITPRRIWAGRVLSGLALAFLAADAAGCATHACAR